jgi:hypothetical protein
MKNYSIVRDGNEYVVRAGEKSVLKISSRRRAAKLITDAAELLQQQPVVPAADVPSISCDPRVTSCDPRGTSCDPPILPDPAEVP